MDRSSDGIFFVDSREQIRYWNRNAEVIFGLSSDEFQNLDLVPLGVLPSLFDLEVVTGDDWPREVGRSVNFRPSNESQSHIVLEIQAIDVRGERWLMIRAKSDCFHKRSDTDLHVQATTDHLSNLLNRRGFQTQLEANLTRQLALAIIDVDYFKQINDTSGHETGDIAIQWLANQLTESFEDAVCIGRLGGDEFGVVLEVSDHEIIETRFQEFCDKISAATLDWYPTGMTISIGVAISMTFGVSARDLLTKADRAMYQSKNEGRNRSTSVNVG